MRHKINFSLVVFITFLTSCASVSSSFKLDPTKNSGLVVGTITYESSLGKYYVTAVRKGSGEQISLAVGNSDWYPFVRMYDEDLKMRGDAFAVEAPAGEYWMGTWAVRQGRIEYHGSKAIGVTFKVEPGKVTYVGNFHYMKNDQVNLQDMAGRDIPILQSRFEAVRVNPLAWKMTEGTKLEAVGGENTRSFLPIYIPVIVK